MAKLVVHQDKINDINELISICHLEQWKKITEN